MQQAYYARPIAEFLGEKLETVLGHLSRHHGHDIGPLQRNAWVDCAHRVIATTCSN